MLTEACSTAPNGVKPQVNGSERHGGWTAFWGEHFCNSEVLCGGDIYFYCCTVSVAQPPVRQSYLPGDDAILTFSTLAFSPEGAWVGQVPDLGAPLV